MSGFISSFADKLLKDGYEIIPIVPKGKFPAVKKWPEVKPDLKGWLKMPPRTGIGIRTKNTPAIDIDVSDEAIVKKLYAWITKNLGDNQLIRVGQAPRFLCVFQTEKTFKKLFSTRYIDFMGDAHQVEILGDGQFFVAFGIHQKTNKNYKWNGVSPRDEKFKRKNLPFLSKQKAQDLINYFESIAPASWKPDTDYSRGQSPSQHVLLNIKQTLNITDDKVKSELKLIDPDITHDEWVRVGMGVYHQYHGSDEGFNIWDNWSQGGSKYHEHLMLIKWHSFEPDTSRTNPVTFATVMRMTADKQPQAMTPSTLFFKSTLEMTQNLGCDKFLVNGYIEDKTFSCLFGDPGSYKSFIAIDMAMCIGMGIPWMGNEVDQGVGLYIAGEGHGGIGKRAMAWCIDRGIQPKDVPVYFSSAAADIYDEKAAIELTIKIEELMEQIQQKIKVIFIDTLARNMGAGDENSTADMNKFINHIDKFLKNKYQCSVVLVHHTGHKDKHRARGSSSFLGALDHSIRVEKMPGLKGVIAVTKMKDAPEPEDLYIQGESVFLGVDKEQNEMNSLIFKKGEAPIIEVKELTDKQTLILDMIKEMAGIDNNPILKLEFYRRVEDRNIYAQGRRAATIIGKLAEMRYIDTDDLEIRLKLETTQ